MSLEKRPTIPYMRSLQSGSLSPELSTPSCSDTSLAIRHLYGHSIAKELLHVTTSSKSNGSTEEGDVDDPEAWSAEAYFTNANYQGKKTAFLLFINRPPSYPSFHVKN